MSNENVAMINISSTCIGLLEGLVEDATRFDYTVENLISVMKDRIEMYKGLKYQAEANLDVLTGGE